ncbi:ECF transporter S component [Fructobacillus durionis]|uniref:Riboflavin transporter n=1 Tax=Fructobacillus durionis TaxID=283737 RepID=A0A1I1EM12_9LACO|nr:ECF transporter S component [Fructobacillus durionis]SFB88134.1 Riboflavin transporter FmnP [Fructobacillus durionis]
MTHHATKRLTILAALTAISFALTIFPKIAILPAASFLKIDFSIVPVFLALSWYGLSSAVLVLVVRTILKIVIFNEGVNTYIGMPVNLAVAIAFVLAIALIWKVQVLSKYPFLKQVLALIAAMALMTLVAIMMNIIWAIPLYSSMAHFDIAKFIGIKVYLWGMVLPFNLIEGIVWYVASYATLSVLAPFKKVFQP